MKLFGVSALTKCGVSVWVVTLYIVVLVNNWGVITVRNCSR